MQGGVWLDMVVMFVFKLLRRLLAKVTWGRVRVRSQIRPQRNERGYNLQARVDFLILLTTIGLRRGRSFLVDVGVTSGPSGCFACDANSRLPLGRPWSRSATGVYIIIQLDSR